MPGKRSRAAYEAELQAEQSPFVAFGTPLPPLDPDIRDDGSFEPIWKQEVRDEQGRRRLHGAFTGGWSAGYYNTVGSKEGWTPSTFVSSRANRRKDDPKLSQQRPEDFMDEEDLADAEEAKKIQTSGAYSGLGLTEHDAVRTSGLAGLFRVEGETMGTKLLKRMGWKEGQGIGPKVRRKARLDVSNKATPDDKSETYLFAPENVVMIAFSRKVDRKGLGYEGEVKLTPLGRQSITGASRASDDDEDDEADGLGRPRTNSGLVARKRPEKGRAGIGIGVLNDTGSDDEDPYEIGPRISYNRVIGGDKKKKKKESATATGGNPVLKAKPVFIPKKAALAKIASGIRKCHDGRPPLEGFVLGQEPDPLISMINSEGKYPPPEIPPDWKSSKAPKNSSNGTSYISTADAAKASKLDPKSRAELLGERQLPGKSVFDFLSSSARDRLAAATGRGDLPQAKGEIPDEYALTEQEKLQQLLAQVPPLDKDTAVAAITRAASGGGPYGDDEGKRVRYRSYLEQQAGYSTAPPTKPSKMTNEEWLREFNEFYSVARIFKPMSGMMASRFTTSSSTSKLASGSDGKGDGVDLITKPPPKPEDPAEEAAKLGMYGPMTRSVKDFYPTRLLCKRFGVNPPAHVQPDQDPEVKNNPRSGPTMSKPYGDYSRDSTTSSSLGFVGRIEAAVGEQQTALDTSSAGGTETAGLESSEIARKEEAVVDAGKNEALEGKRAGEDVFRAIFGDSDDDED